MLAHVLLYVRLHGRQAATKGTIMETTHEGTQENREFDQIIASEQALQEEGQQILDEAGKFIGRFTVLQSPASRDALVLFAAHCWIFRVFANTPRLHITACGYGAGKSRTGRLTGLLCPRTQKMDKVTGPAIYHVIPERDPAPLILDEADANLGGANSKRAEDIRGILNAGYEEGGVVTRVVGGEAVDCDVYCPVILIGKGQIPHSLADRALTITMTKRRKSQQMDRFVARIHEDHGRKIGRNLGAWATKIAGPAGDILWADAPDSLDDRTVDILTPLYAVAQMAGGEWPQRFDEIVRVLVLGGISSDEVSPAQALLAGIRDVWPRGRDKLATHELAELLTEHESGEFDWPPDVRTAELNAQMRDLELAPEPVRIGGRVMRGYAREPIEAACARVL